MGTEIINDIIIVTYNRLEYLKKCFWSVWASVTLKRRIIVVDQHSTDGTVNWLKEMYDRGLISKLILLENNVGSAEGNNIGINASKSDWFLLLCDDFYMHRDWDIEAQKIINAFPNVECIPFYYSSPLNPDAIKEYMIKEGKRIGMRLEGGGLAGFYMKRTLYERLGPFKMNVASDGRGKYVGFWAPDFIKKMAYSNTLVLAPMRRYCVDMDAANNPLNEIRTYLNSGYNEFRQKEKPGGNREEFVKRRLSIIQGALEKAEYERKQMRLP